MNSKIQTNTLVYFLVVFKEKKERLWSGGGKGAYKVGDCHLLSSVETAQVPNKP